METFGSFVRSRRLALDLGLREFCQVAALVASDHSKVERGLKAAPTDDEGLETYARALRIAPGSEDATTLRRLAEASESQISQSDPTDEDLAGKLPLLLGKGPFPDAQLDEIFETIREAHRPERRVA